MLRIVDPVLERVLLSDDGFRKGLISLSIDKRREWERGVKPKDALDFAHTFTVPLPARFQSRGHSDASASVAAGLTGREGTAESGIPVAATEAWKVDGEGGDGRESKGESGSESERTMSVALTGWMDGHTRNLVCGFDVCDHRARTRKHKHSHRHRHSHSRNQSSNGSQPSSSRPVSGEGNTRASPSGSDASGKANENSRPGSGSGLGKGKVQGEGAGEGEEEGNANRNAEEKDRKRDLREHLRDGRRVVYSRRFRLVPNDDDDEDDDNDESNHNHNHNHSRNHSHDANAKANANANPSTTPSQTAGAGVEGPEEGEVYVDVNLNENEPNGKEEEGGSAGSAGSGIVEGVIKAEFWCLEWEPGREVWVKLVVVFDEEAAFKLEQERKNKPGTEQARRASLGPGAEANSNSNSKPGLGWFGFWGGASGGGASGGSAEKSVDESDTGTGTGTGTGTAKTNPKKEKKKKKDTWGVGWDDGAPGGKFEDEVRLLRYF